MLAQRGASKLARRKCFVSYHQDDENEVQKFIDDFGGAFIPKVLGVSDVDDFINSTDTEYVLRRIRELYLSDSTVTIVMIGQCTWARKYVDWEIASTLRNDQVNKRSGLLGITLPSVANLSSRKMPPRLAANVLRNANNDDYGYGRWKIYPRSESALASMIEEVFDLRESLNPDNSLELYVNNRSC